MRKEAGWWGMECGESSWGGVGVDGRSCGVGVGVRNSRISCR